MKDYFLKIVKDGVTIDVAHTQADTQELANGAITNAAIGRGMVNFSVVETTQEEFDTFRAKQKPDDDKQAEADAKAAEEQAQRDAEALAAKEAEEKAAAEKAEADRLAAEEAEKNASAGTASTGTDAPAPQPAADSENPQPADTQEPGTEGTEDKAAA